MLEMRPRRCPVCGSADETRVYAPANLDPAKFNAYSFASRKLPEYMHHRLVECPVCDLVYANPVPVNDALSAAYEEAAFDSQVEARYAARTYASYLPQIGRRLPALAGALDIGAGDGAFLAELTRAGFTDVIGVEPSRAPIAAAAAEVRSMLRQEMFQADTAPPNSLSLVTCFQTIEHLADPLAACKEAWRALRPGGALFLIGHNRRAVSAKVLGRKSPIFDVEHLQLFSPRSFTELLERAGFAEVSVSRVVNRYPLSYWAKLFPLPAGIKAAAIKLLSLGPIRRLAIPAPVGNLAAIAYKPAVRTSPVASYARKIAC